MIFYQILCDYTYESLDESDWPQIWSQVTPNFRMPDLKILIFPMAFELGLIWVHIRELPCWKNRNESQGSRDEPQLFSDLISNPSKSPILFLIVINQTGLVFRAMLLNAKMLWGEKGLTQKANSSCRMGTCAAFCFTQAFLLYLLDSLGERFFRDKWFLINKSLENTHCLHA